MTHTMTSNDFRITASKVQIKGQECPNLMASGDPEDHNHASKCPIFNF